MQSILSFVLVACLLRENDQFPPLINLMKMKTHMASTMYSKVPNCQGGQNRQGVGTEEINKLESWNKWGGVVEILL